MTSNPQEADSGSTPSSRPVIGAAPLTPQDIVALIDPATEWKYRRALCREAYERGFAAGYENGRADACVALAEMQNEWDAEDWEKEARLRRRSRLAAEKRLAA